MSDTLVVRLSPEEGRRLYEALGRGSFAFRPVPHARWSAQGEETTVTLYASGKLVVQGRGTGAFAGRYLPGAASAPASGPDAAPAAGPSAAAALEGPAVGSDESGKGDYFGPLCVAAVLVRPSDVAGLARLGVRDSKLASRGLVLGVEAALGRLPHALRVLEPQAYNAAHAEVGNVNVLLGRLHAEAIEEVLAAAGDADARIVVDRFGDPRHVVSHLGEATRRRAFTMVVRAEDHPAVAAASFLARAAFLRGMDALAGDAGGPLPRGASDPRIPGIARRLLAEGGRAWLGRFAKLHFRITPP